MNDVARKVFQKLDEIGIQTAFVEHPPAHTMEDCRAAGLALSADIPKNIFLTFRNKSAFYLLIMRIDARFKTADISKQLGVARLSFAGEEDMRTMLDTYPGAVTPMGLLFDKAHAVHVVVDSALRDMPVLGFHPCDNTVSLAMTNDDFFGKFLPTLGYAPAQVEIHDFIEN